MAFVSDLDIPAFFSRGSSGVFYSRHSCCISGSYLKIQILSPVATHSMQMRMQVSFYSVVKFFGTNFAHIFCMFNSLVKICRTVSLFMWMRKAICRTDNRWSSFNAYSTFCRKMALEEFYTNATSDMWYMTFEYIYKWWRGNYENLPLPTIDSAFQCVKVDLPFCIDVCTCVYTCAYVLKWYSALFFLLKKINIPIFAH